MSTVLNAAVEAVARALDGYGIDPVPVARGAGVEIDRADPGTRLGAERFHGFVAAAADASGDEAFGLALARQFAVFNYHLHFAMAASPDLAAAIEQFVRFQRFISGGLKAAFHRGETACTFVFEVPEPPVARWVPTDTMTGSMILTGRSLTLQPRLTPFRLDVRRPRTAVAKAAYQELFGCPVRFGQPENRLVFGGAVMHAPLPTANPTMLERAEAMLVEYGRLDAGGLKHRLTRLVVAELRNGVPRRAAMARRLGVSDRSLGRHLAAEGTSYRAILEDVRSSVAREYLADGHTSVTEVAFLLGFSDATAFSRAFRRWTGVTPRAFAQAASAS